MKNNEVTIFSFLSNNEKIEKYDGIKITSHGMILVNVDYNGKRYWLWLNNVSEDAYAIGTHSYPINDNFYSEIFKIIKDYRNQIDEAKIRILGLLDKHTNN